MSKLSTTYCAKRQYCEADTARSADTTAKPSTLGNLTREISHSLRHPGRRTLTLIDKALSYLRPFESADAGVASAYERRDLLELLNTHRMTLCPYLDIDRVEWNLRRCD